MDVMRTTTARPATKKSRSDEERVTATDASGKGMGLVNQAAKESASTGTAAADHTARTIDMPWAIGFVPRPASHAAIRDVWMGLLSPESEA